MAFMAAVQGLYFLITGIWPFLHMASFLKITGPKTDLWLVKTVGIVVSAIGIGLLVAGIARQVDSITVLIALSSAAGLMAIDVAYVLKPHIPHL